MMKVAIMLGSVRSGRQTHKPAYFLEKSLISRGIDTDLVDLMMEPLPVFGDPSGKMERNGTYSSIAKRLDEADAIILITPEYHGSFSGVLKNALDFFGKEFSKKPIGVSSVSTGGMGGINASTQLQQVVLSMGAFPMPYKWLVPFVDQAFDDNFNPQHEKIVKTVRKFIDEFLWFADAIYQKKFPEESIMQSNSKIN